MTEKRSEYRKRRKNKQNKLLSGVRSAFSSDSADGQKDVDVQPDFERSASERQQILAADRENYLKQNQELSREEKSLRLKKKLNHAILIVIVLIVLVLLALFYL